MYVYCISLSLTASTRSHFTPCKNVDKWTVDFKMCSAATSAIINSNLKIAARYCPAFSSPSCCSCSKACTTGKDTRKVYKESARLVQRVSHKVRNFQRESFNYLITYRLNNHSWSRELITFLYDVADQTNF